MEANIDTTVTSLYYFDVSTVPDDRLAYYRAFLNKEEQARAERFRQDKHRHRFILARGYLRKLLADFLKLEPKSIVFQVNSHGKPSLAKDLSGPYFNLSHSKDWVLYAFNDHYPLGIDIEYQAPRKDFTAIVERFFASSEAQQLAQLDEKDKLLGFYRGWTCKEAILKAMGLGLSFSLKDCIVDLDPNKKAKLLSLENNQKNQNWSLINLDLVPNYSAALAINGPSSVIKKVIISSV